MSTIEEIAKQTAGMVATAMGEGWTVDTDPKFDGYPGCYLQNRDGLRFYLSVNPWRHEGKVQISTAWPDGYRDVSTRDLPEPTIYVSRDRGPGVIAKEIKRRFLPEYTVALATLNDRIAHFQAGDEVRLMVAERLAKIPGWTEARGDTHYGPHGMRIEVQWGGSMYLSSGALPAALGLAVAALISSHQGARS